jgi:hypothetical protein
MSWRTNRKTKTVFPVGQRPEAIERNQQEQEGEIVPEESEAYTCAGCGKAFTGQAYEIDGEIVCPECNRLDNRLQRKARQDGVPEHDTSSGVGLPEEEADDASGKGNSWWGDGVS